MKYDWRCKCHATGLGRDERNAHKEFCDGWAVHWKEPISDGETGVVLNHDPYALAAGGTLAGYLIKSNFDERPPKLTAEQVWERIRTHLKCPNTPWSEVCDPALWPHDFCTAVAEVFGAPAGADHSQCVSKRKQEETAAAYDRQWDYWVGCLKKDKEVFEQFAAFLTSLNAYMQRDKLPAELQRQFVDVTRMLMRAVNPEKADK